MDVDIFASFWFFLQNSKLYITKEEFEGKMVDCYYKKIDYDFNIDINNDNTLNNKNIFLASFQYSYPNLSEDERLLYKLYDLKEDNKSLIYFGYFFKDFVLRFSPHKQSISKNNIMKTLEDLCFSDIKNSKEFKRKNNIKELNIPLLTFYHILNPLTSSKGNLPKIFKEGFDIQKYNNDKKKSLSNNTCVYCNNKPINSHIISDFILKNICNDSMVYTTNFSYEILEIENLKYNNFKELSFIGIEKTKSNLFTTYPLFCHHHDSLIIKNINMENNENLYSRSVNPNYNAWAGKKINQRFLFSFLIQTIEINSILENTIHFINDKLILEYVLERQHKYNQLLSLICDYGYGFNYDFYVELDIKIPIASIVIRKNLDLFHSSFFTFNEKIIKSMSYLSDNGYSILSITPKEKSTIFYISFRNISENDVKILKQIIEYLRKESSKEKECKYTYFIKDFIILTFLGYGYLFFSPEYFKNVHFLQKNILIHLLNIKDDSFNRNNDKIKINEDYIKQSNLNAEIFYKKGELYKRYILSYFIEKIIPPLPNQIRYIHGLSYCNKSEKFSK